MCVFRTAEALVSVGPTTVAIRPVDSMEFGPFGRLRSGRRPGNHWLQPVAAKKLKAEDVLGPQARTSIPYAPHRRTSALPWAT